MKFGTAAANGDREIGELIAKAFEKGWGNDLQVLAVSSFLNSSASFFTFHLPHLHCNNCCATPRHRNGPLVVEAATPYSSAYVEQESYNSLVVTQSI
ncbi:hypothetical protein WN944_023775 [Citrus x changshan-huyou]|uniref:Uncharacterized protein n=1 Tax=Citrus x changshan-huyou TaxID=2935761 RepID=A0AAP0LM82_9ROSI